MVLTEAIKHWKAAKEKNALENLLKTKKNKNKFYYHRNLSGLSYIFMNGANNFGANTKHYFTLRFPRIDLIFQ